MIENETGSESNVNEDDAFIDSLLPDFEEIDESDESDPADDVPSNDDELDSSDAKGKDAKPGHKPKKSRASERVQNAISERNQARADANRLSTENTDLKRQVAELTEAVTLYDQSFKDMEELKRQFLPQNSTHTVKTETQEAASGFAFKTQAELDEYLEKKIADKEATVRKQQNENAVLTESLRNIAKSWMPSINRVEKGGVVKVTGFMHDYIQINLKDKVNREAIDLMEATGDLKYAPEALYAAHQKGDFARLSLGRKIATVRQVHEAISSKKDAVTKSEPAPSTPRGGSKTDLSKLSFEERWKANREALRARKGR